MNQLTGILDRVINHLQHQLTGLTIASYHSDVNDLTANLSAVASPCLLVTFLSSNLSTSVSGELRANTQWQAFLVLNQPQDDQQLLVDILNSLNGSALGLSALPVCLNGFHQVIAKPAVENKNIWCIRWQQKIPLLISEQTAEQPIPQTILASRSPLVGEKHKEHYQHV